MIPPTAKPVLETDAAHTPSDADAPMTSDQADMLRVMCEAAGEPFDASLTQSQAVARIEELRKQTNEDQNL
ncbi:DUF3072 domain-containing protein [Loktanella sp. SALINAS62]|uniref:DUF3072 domain-containing protein n=1 Tax=Loktanella sp. SALINAS62 TaxID=2706124 RepID=UPI001B8BB5DB|nr:DUF3072 domain-containing protein [Loktanella sp. SALINAS62]MBS1303348.1 DUF3072 domain-containing protein [Loktanella sp. SALINAS62]